MMVTYKHHFKTKFRTKQLPEYGSTNHKTEPAEVVISSLQVNNCKFNYIYNNEYSKDLINEHSHQSFGLAIAPFYAQILASMTCF